MRETGASVVGPSRNGDSQDRLPTVVLQSLRKPSEISFGPSNFVPDW